MTTFHINAYVGTSGFSYAEWKGSFYPDKLPNKGMLAFYSSKLPSVEINNTFYRMPRRALLEGWAEQTPLHFRFAVKAPKGITHFKKLRDSGELLNYLFRALTALGERTGPVLFQLPPTMKADIPLLVDFLAEVRALSENEQTALSRLLPAFEFRHPTWFCDQTYAALEAGNAALVSGDLDDSEKDPPLVRTAPFVYLRLRKTEYQAGELSVWAKRLRQVGVSEIYAYFKHEVAGPELASELQTLLTS